MKPATVKDLKILFIEDDDIIRTEFSEILRRKFNNVITAKNGSDGLAIFTELFKRDDSFDLIISDLNMPIMNGLTLLEEVRKIDQKIPFIFATAQTDIAYLQKAIKLNANEYLIKPIDIKDLLNKSNEIFNNIYLTKNSDESDVKKYTEVINKVAIISKTDKNGIITYANKYFCYISGYSKEELLGKSHNIIRHPDMPKETFKDLWKVIQEGKIWKGKLKNRDKNGKPYFTDSTIIPLYDTDENEIVEYIGIRFLLT